MIYINNMKIKQIIKNILIVLLPLLGGIIVSLLTDSKSYKVLNKPLLSPPSIVFPIAWTILYLLMGISLLISLKENKESDVIKSFVLQLIFNYLWPILFFTLKMYTFSIVVLLILIVLVINIIINLYKSKKIAGILQFPYFIWLLFALYLNIGVAILN